MIVVASDVARLTRPDRLRLRPPLGFRSLATRRIAVPVGREPASVARSDDVNKDSSRRSVVSEVLVVGGRQRTEYDDYAIAKEIAEERKKTGRPRFQTKSRTGGLPSLSDPKSFREARAKSAAATAEEPVGKEAKVLKPSIKGKEKAIIEEADQAEKSTSQHDVNTSGLRRNPVGVQLLSPSLHSQLFPGPALPRPPKRLIDISTSHLATNGLLPSQAAVLPEINFSLPPLRGSNIRQHFHNLGSHTAEPYLSLAKRFAEIELPPVPESWVLDHPGWVKYASDGTYEFVDDLGDEEIVCFDVETLYKLSKYPVMATAATPDYWYSWLCPTIFESPPHVIPEKMAPWEKDEGKHHPHDLIPLFTGKKDRMVVGHNVGYDRARVKEEYSLERTSTRWLDTLALHVATRGITSVQRPAWMIHKKNKREKAKLAGVIAQYLEENENLDLENSETAAGKDDIDTAAESSAQKWEDVTSMNSLAEVASLHCGIPVDKSIRNRFSDETISHASLLRPELHDLLAYCANDVKVTHQVYQKVWPLFLESCPHPATFSGVLTMGNSFLPVDESWREYLRNAESKYRELDEGVRKALRVLAEKIRKGGEENARGDPWYGQLDWSEKNARWPDDGQNVPAPTRAFMESEAALDSTASAAADQSTGYASDTAKSEASTPVGSSEMAPSTGNATLTAYPSDQTSTPSSQSNTVPAWFESIQKSPSAYLASAPAESRFIPLLLRMTFLSHPVIHLANHLWCFKVSSTQSQEYIPIYGEPVTPNQAELQRFGTRLDGHYLFRVTPIGKSRRSKLSGPGVSGLHKSKQLDSAHEDVLKRLMQKGSSVIVDDLLDIAMTIKDQGDVDDWTMQLDWTPRIDDRAQLGRMTSSAIAAVAKSLTVKLPASKRGMYGTWPKWYHDMTRSATNADVAFGTLDLTCKKTVAPLLLRLQWDGCPLFHSREHKWLYRVPKSAGLMAISGGGSRGAVTFAKHGQPVTFTGEVQSFQGNSEANDEDEAEDESPVKAFKGDEHLINDTQHWYFRLPHKDGEGKNVGSPLSKSFVKAIETGQLSSAAAIEGDGVASKAATDATQMNVLCSYWIAARERIMDQFVVYDEKSPTSGMILPQVITMGTVTRRAVEATWLTASNAKKNRVGSELKAMVRAPPGYSIVGADVDSEELWISSVMGDSQFGMHGATAIGWMTLEGTKSAGTDLHSKTADILSTSRDAAKVFNYSRIYGAGQKHAEQLLIQGDPSLSKEDATKRAKELYARTKGDKTRRGYKLSPAMISSLWHGGTESYLFNTLEAIALSERPTTPALGCGVTKALAKNYLEEGSAFLPSRINWVVQSSGVDYLHLLIVSMEYLIKTYNIDARYLISVHDEVRYLAKEEDRYRCALALQIANAWTRALFCYNLGMDDVPQGVAFFSAVDVDHVLRKEVFMSCQTPSHPDAIPPGESLDIFDLLKVTNGQLGSPKIVAGLPTTIDAGPPVSLFPDITSPIHAAYLNIQANRTSFPVRAWLDLQHGVTSQHDKAAPMRKVERARKVSKAVMAR